MPAHTPFKADRAMVEKDGTPRVEKERDMIASSCRHPVGTKWVLVMGEGPDLNLPTSSVALGPKSV